MKRLSHRGHKDKSKAFDGTINSKSVELVHALLELLNKQTSLEGIYRIPGDMGEVRRTKEALNQGKKVSYESMNPHTQASLLKSFLKELADPVFTAKLYPGWIAATQHKDRKILITRLLNMLPQQNLQIISTLMIHLRHISEYHTSNLMTAENLAIVFGPILLRPSSVSVETLFADVPYVNKCIGMLINDCSFFFKNKLVLLHRQTKQTSLFEEMRRAGAELIIEERKRREKEEKRLKEEQRKSERKKKYNTYSSSKRQTVKALLDTEFDPAIDDHGNVGHHHPSTSPAPDPSSPSSARNKGNSSGSPDMGARLAVRPQTSYNPASAPMLPTPTTSTSPRPPLPPLPENLPPPPPVSAGTLRRSVSAYNPVPAIAVGGHNGGGTNSARASSPRARPTRPVGIMMTPPAAAATAGPTSPDVPRSNGHHHHNHTRPLEYDDKGIPVPPPPPPPLELTEEEKRRKEDDENLLHNMRRRYVDRRKQTLDRWFKRKNDWTEEEFNKAMEERAARIENGEYSPQDLQMWFAEMGAGDDEDPLNVSQSSNVSLNHQIRSREGSPALSSRQAHHHHHGTPTPATTTSSGAVDTTLCVS